MKCRPCWPAIPPICRRGACCRASTCARSAISPMPPISFTPCNWPSSSCTEIVRLDPTDEDSAVWLARLDRLNNQHDLAEKVLRGVLQRDPENEAARSPTRRNSCSTRTVRAKPSPCSRTPSRQSQRRPLRSTGRRLYADGRSHARRAGLSPGGGSGSRRTLAPARPGAISVRHGRFQRRHRCLPETGGHVPQ